MDLLGHCSTRDLWPANNRCVAKKIAHSDTACVGPAQNCNHYGGASLRLCHVVTRPSTRSSNKNACKTMSAWACGPLLIPLTSSRDDVAFALFFAPERSWC